MTDTKQPEGEYSGGNVNYYVVEIKHPKRMHPYAAECEDIAEALEMTPHEFNGFKSIWRRAAQRQGRGKKGADPYGLYDAQKIKHAGERLIAQAMIAAGEPPPPGNAVERLEQAEAKLRQLGYYPDRSGQWHSVRQDLAERVPSLERRSS